MFEISFISSRSIRSTVLIDYSAAKFLNNLSTKTRFSDRNCRVGVRVSTPYRSSVGYTMSRDLRSPGDEDWRTASAFFSKRASSIPPIVRDRSPLYSERVTVANNKQNTKPRKRVVKQHPTRLSECTSVFFFCRPII